MTSLHGTNRWSHSVPCSEVPLYYNRATHIWQAVKCFSGLFRIVQSIVVYAVLATYKRKSALRLLSKIASYFKAHIRLVALEEETIVSELMKTPKPSVSASSTVIRLNVTINDFWGVLYCRVIAENSLQEVSSIKE